MSSIVFVLDNNNNPTYNAFHDDNKMIFKPFNH